MTTAASASPDLLADWNTLGEGERAAITKALVELVASRLRSNPFYPGIIGSEPTAEVHGATRTGTGLAVHFVADHYMYCFAQSGSDWAEHFMFRGEATFVDGKPAGETVELVSTIKLSERQTENYETRSAIAPIRDAAIAKLRDAQGSKGAKV